MLGEPFALVGEDASGFWREYDERCKKLEEEGCTRSDAQGIIDLELQRAGRMDRNFKPVTS